MKIYKSNILNALFTKIFRNVVILIYWIGFTKILEISPLQVSIGTIVITYLFLLFVELFFTNNNLIIDTEKQSIKIQSSILENIKSKEYNLNNIEKIVFKHEWEETFLPAFQGAIWRQLLLGYIIAPFIPTEYKWIKIYTKSGNTFTHYFFGMNYSSFEDVDIDLFEDMFLELANYCDVEWTSVEDKYFKSIQENANNIRINIKKEPNI